MRNYVHPNRAHYEETSLSFYFLQYIFHKCLLLPYNALWKHIIIIIFFTVESLLLKLYIYLLQKIITILIIVD